MYAQEEGLDQAKVNWLNHPVFGTTKDKPTVITQLTQMVDDYSGWHWLNADPRIKLNPPAIDRLGEIKAPTQIILGELDLPYYHDIANILTDRISNSKLHTIKDSGHMVNMESRLEFNSLISEFIASE